ncbi:MAG: flagellar export chaperone FliS [Nitrospiraceae bacterium]|nr:MAG: flagellar export chaperone FliS [Nitrospiraceae bacterium]
MDFNGYKKTVFATTDRVKIILMLYEGALTHLKIARQKIETGDIISKGRHFSKATSIISELSNVLDMEKGGEISTNLRGLYDFVLQRLLYANMNNDVKALEEAEKVMGTLKDGWKEMMKEARQPVEIGI